MKANRLEAFSDGVIAIIITIMVLELKVPHGGSAEALRGLLPVFLSYLLSFVMVAVYWVNHHHLIHLADRVDGTLLWCNINLLFWLSLFPFVTANLGENCSQPLSMALYAFIALSSALSWALLKWAMGRNLRHDPTRIQLLNETKLKNWVSVAMYACAIPVAYVSMPLSILLCVMPALLYFVPDRRAEQGKH